MEMIQPNRLKQAQTELGNLTFSNGYEIPTEIQKRGSDSVYLFIGIKAYDSADGFTKRYEARTSPASMRMYNKMQRHVTKGIYKGLFNGIFDKLVLLHDPTIKPAKVEKKVKALSPKHKKEVKALMEENKSAEEISIELGIDIERIEAFLK